MNEIKPEHLPKELIKILEHPLYKIQFNTTAGRVCEIVNFLQQHDFTVLKPGELYWVETRKNETWKSLGEFTGELYVVDQSVAGNSYYANARSFPSPEAAKTYCQKLEDQARKEQA